MAHYAKIENDTVIEIIVAEQDFINSGVVGEPTVWLQTSYNTYGGVHYGENGLPDDKPPLRKNYAGIGFTYDKNKDAFIPPKPYPNWVLNSFSCLWEAPVPYPDDGKKYYWHEATVSWVTQ